MTVVMGMLVFAGAGAVRGAGFAAGRDTVRAEVRAVPQEVRATDAVMSREQTGPGMEVNAEAVPVVEEQLPGLSEVLGQFRIPFRGKVISRYGMRSGRMHTGTDIKLYRGDTIYAAYDGVVTRASKYYGYGNLVVISHVHDLETYWPICRVFWFAPEIPSGRVSLWGWVVVRAGPPQSTSILRSVKRGGLIIPNWCMILSIFTSGRRWLARRRWRS